MNLRKQLLLVSLLSAFSCYAQINQKEACEKFKSAVVRIDTGRPSHGTGFVVGEDGWIMTVAHVVINTQTGVADTGIQVTMPDHSIEIATSVLPVTTDVVGKDYALLKVRVNPSQKLAFLKLGNGSEIKEGMDIAIIGFPFSAIGRTGNSITTKLCFSGSVAGIDTDLIPVNTTQGAVNVPTDIVYFQGPSIKGLSGSPIISKETGNVIAILSTKLTGLSQSLLEMKQGTERGSGVTIGGLDPSIAVHEILNVLDNQLANGLGSGVGIDDPALAFSRARRSNATKKK